MVRLVFDQDEAVETDRVANVHPSPETSKIDIVEDLYHPLDSLTENHNSQSQFYLAKSDSALRDLSTDDMRDIRHWEIIPTIEVALHSTWHGKEPGRQRQRQGKQGCAPRGRNNDHRGGDP